MNTHRSEATLMLKNFKRVAKSLLLYYKGERRYVIKNHNNLAFFCSGLQISFCWCKKILDQRKWTHVVKQQKWAILHSRDEFTDLQITNKISMTRTTELLCCHGGRSGFCTPGGEMGTVPFLGVSILTSRWQWPMTRWRVSTQDMYVITFYFFLKMQQRGRMWGDQNGDGVATVRVWCRPSTSWCQLLRDFSA